LEQLHVTILFIVHVFIRGQFKVVVVVLIIVVFLIVVVKDPVAIVFVIGL
jgi:hypothetical protein